MPGWFFGGFGLYGIVSGFDSHNFVEGLGVSKFGLLPCKYLHNINGTLNPKPKSLKNCHLDSLSDSVEL